MKIVIICVSIIVGVSLLTYIVGTYLEYRKKKVIDEINRQLESIYDNENK